ncbi:hypothetical protein [Nitrospira sp. BLG_2]|uniref:hypothetical protein n=1 Tax=Nitrospira sp. BLG_2 TaxID=3397507 RepID=UPI003B9ABB8F
MSGRKRSNDLRFTQALLLSIGLVTGCAGTSVVPEMVIYQSGLNQVYLEKDPNPDLSSHPTSLTPNEVGLLLRGVRVWKQRNIVYRLLAGEAERTRAFRNEEVAVLAPALSRALELASPDQRIYFHLSHVTEYGEEETTSGWLSIRGDVLYLTLSEAHDRHSPGPDISKYDRQMPNVPEQAQAFHATFEPEEYLRAVRSGWRLLTTNQREELQIQYRDALDALTQSPRS